MWAAGAVAAMSSITFPAISAIVSRNADPDQQGEHPPSTSLSVDQELCVSVRERRPLFHLRPMLLTCVCAPPGVVQGMITGIRGLCNGLGPALYGFVFYLFHVELTDLDGVDGADKGSKPNMANPTDEVSPPSGRATSSELA